VLLVVGLLQVHGARPGVARVLDGAGAAAVALLGVVTVQLGRKQLAGVTDFLLVLTTVVAVSRFACRWSSCWPCSALAVWLYPRRGRTHEHAAAARRRLRAALPAGGRRRTVRASRDELTVQHAHC
jgi:chromate transport protein ChrA